MLGQAARVLPAGRARPGWDDDGVLLGAGGLPSAMLRLLGPSWGPSRAGLLPDRQCLRAAAAARLVHVLHTEQDDQHSGTVILK